MPDPLNPIQLRRIDYVLRYPNKFTKADVHAAALELRAEVERLNKTQNVPIETPIEGPRS